jgi:glycerol-3-phosphate acyltransferase PlsX
MGGDRGPLAILEGALKALPDLTRTKELVILGDEAIVKAALAKSKFRGLAQAMDRGTASGCKVSVMHAPETIEMADSIRAIRNKPNASINIGCGLAAKDYKAGKSCAFISTGHSGAMMASALLSMGRLKGVERPAIAVKLPSLSEDGCVVLDVGANVDCKPEHLRDFAVMGALFARVERKKKTLPKVGVLSNGEERSKGNELTRATLELIDRLDCFKKDAPIGNFIGYTEGKEIFKGDVDVVVTDGFVGNIVLKTAEGLGSAVVSILKKEAKRSLFAPIGFLFAAGVFARLKKKLDYAEYGAAPLLGVAGYAFICHGRSNAKAIRSALLRAEAALEAHFVEDLGKALAAGATSSGAASPAGAAQ